MGNVVVKSTIFQGKECVCESQLGDTFCLYAESIGYTYNAEFPSTLDSFLDVQHTIGEWKTYTTTCHHSMLPTSKHTDSMLVTGKDIQQGSTAATMSMPMFKNLGPERPDYSYDFNPWDVLGLDLVYHTRITIIEQSQAYHTANLPAAR